MALQNAFGNLALDSTASGIATSLASGISVQPTNVVTAFRDPFESFTPGSGWTLTTGSGDLVVLDGNTASASYLVISKDPLTAGTETSLQTIASFLAPVETAIGLSMSQRVLGQELAMELKSDEASLATPSELAISSISQAASVLTVTTTLAHDLVPGKRIGIYGVSDSRLNYASLVVASIPATNQFTCTAGPGGTIASVTAGPYASGYVYHRSGLGYAKNGASQIFENATATNASLYVRANSGDLLPGGTASTNHSSTVSTTVGTQAVNTAYSYSWLPASEYRLTLQPDKFQFIDAGIDGTGSFTTRLLRTQVIPDPQKRYNLRFRFSNNKGLTVPTAKIISAVKAGSTTATITTSTPHGLTTNDYIVIYGIRDQTNFANLTTATAVVSTPTSTSFTIAFGASATATSYGGMVSRVQGSNIPAAYNAIAVQSVANDGASLTLVGSATWTWSIGDYVNLYGCGDNATGADLLVDGVYKVASIATTTMILLPIGSTVLPSSFATTNAGGTTIKRTDIRISHARLFEYDRERVEVQGTSAQAASVPVSINGTPAVSITGTPTVTASTTTGSAAHDAAVTGNPVRVAGRAINAAYTTVANGDTADVVTTLQGVLITRPYQIPELEWSYAAASSGISNTADVAIAAAAGAGLRRYLKSTQLSNHSAVATEAVFKDGSTIVWRGYLPASMTTPVDISFENPLKTSTNTALNFACVASGAQVYVNAQGYTAA